MCRGGAHRLGDSIPAGPAFETRGMTRKGGGIREVLALTGCVQHLQPPKSCPGIWTAAACCRFPKAALLPPESLGHRGILSAGANAGAHRRGIALKRSTAGRLASRRRQQASAVHVTPTGLRISKASSEHSPHQLPGWRKQTAGCAKQTAGCGKQTAGCGKRTAGCRERTAGCRERTAGCRKRTAGCGKRTAGCGKRTAGCRKRTAGCRKRTAECGKQTAGCGKRTAGCCKRTAGCGKQTAGCGKQTAGCRKPLNGRGSRLKGSTKSWGGSNLRFGLRPALERLRRGFFSFRPA